MQKKELIGAWLLRSWQMVDENGNKSFPFEREVKGTLIYSENGYMSANILSMSRKIKIDEGISEKSILAGKGVYLSYSGRYTLFGDKVIHHVMVSSIREWVGSEQERYFRLEANKLIIDSKTQSKNGQTGYHQLVWEKPS